MCFSLFCIVFLRHPSAPHPCRTTFNKVALSLLYLIFIPQVNTLTRSENRSQLREDGSPVLPWLTPDMEWLCKETHKRLVPTVNQSYRIIPIKQLRPRPSGKGRWRAGKYALENVHVHPSHPLPPYMLLTTSSRRGGVLPCSVCWLHFMRVATVGPEKQQSIKPGFNVGKLGLAFRENSKYTSTYLGKGPNV